jgi:hypothetical protein
MDCPANIDRQVTPMVPGAARPAAVPTVLW